MDDFIPTRASSNKKNIDEVFEVTTFASRKRKDSSKVNTPHSFVKAKRHAPDENSETDEEHSHKPKDQKSDPERELKKYRFEVMKLGISGFERPKALKAKVALAISLGAEPPKNKRKNYKNLIVKRKEQKNAEAKKKKFESGFNINHSTKLKNYNVKNAKNKNSKGILGVYGKVTKDKKT